MQVKTELEAVGAVVNVVRGRGLLICLAPACVLGVVASVRAGLLVLCMSLLLRKALLLARAPSSILSASRSPASLFPGLSAALVWGPLLLLLGLGAWLIPELGDSSVTGVREILALLAAAFVAGMVTLAIRFARPPLSPWHTPQPPSIDQWIEVLRPEKDSAQNGVPLPRKIQHASAPTTAV